MSKTLLYVSYDGAAEPLGQSQVVAYLAHLAAAYEVTLVSFEKPADAARAPAVRRQLEALGVRWVPLRYHKRPAVLSTALDVAMGAWWTARELRRGRPAVVNARSYVAGLMVLLARPGREVRFVFDIRGFWADERAEAGFWDQDSVLHRAAKRCERALFARSDAVVTLTHASRPQIQHWLGERNVQVHVIPTCAPVERFAGSVPREGAPHAVWSGSLGPWYRFDLAVALARALELPFTVLTRQPELARESLNGLEADVRSVEPAAMAGELHAGDIGLCLIRSTFSKTASAPTRFAEYLAAGMPVAVTPGVGDLEDIVEDERIGVVLHDESPGGVADAARGLRELAADPAVHERCRRVAGERFDTAAGAARYRALYESL